MRRGPWHQFGDRSQKLALEQLENGVGVGVIISPRDLSWENAISYAERYRDLDADILIDQQFYLPDFINKNISSYPISCHRTSVQQLCQISGNELIELTNRLVEINAEIKASAVIAPAVIYENGRSDLIQLNSRLFSAAKRAADCLGIPVYASIMLGSSCTASDEVLLSILSHATSLESDGWYFGYQFPEERIPSSFEHAYRFMLAGMSLAVTGTPMLHAFAGPMAIVSLASGATGMGIGHFQNQWRFTPSRWHHSTGQGGGGDAPPRFFSTKLWGTIIYPDELAQLSTSMKSRIITSSPYSSPVSSSSQLPWPKWKSNKHLVYSICDTIGLLSDEHNPRIIAGEVAGILDAAIELHQEISDVGLELSDNTNAYQENWRDAIVEFLSNNFLDYDYLELIQ